MLLVFFLLLRILFRGGIVRSSFVIICRSSRPFVGSQGLHDTIIPQAILRIIDGKFAVMHFVGTDTVGKEPQEGKFHIVRRMIEHGHGGVNVEKAENGSGMCSR